MAGEITGLTQLTAPDGPLEIEVVDTGDTSMASSGTNKRMLYGGLTLIETITNGSAGEFDFTVPAGFTHVLIKANIRSTAAANNSGLYTFLNSDTTVSNYFSQQMNNRNVDIQDGASSAPFSGACPANTSPANSYGAFDLLFPFYTGSQLKMVDVHFLSYYAAATMRNGDTAIASAITAAVTRIRFRTADHPTSGLVGTASLYGIM